MKTVQNVSVAPVAGGWCVECRGVAEPLVFLSGGRAETQARALAIALSRAGHDAHVLINDRASRVIGTGLYFAVSAAEANLNPPLETGG